MGILRKELEFLEDGDIYQYYQNMIKDAKKSILILSPFLGLSGHIKDALTDQANNGVDITIITRHKKDGNAAHKKDIEFIMKNLGRDSIYFDKHLHAKLLITDNKELVLSSANFTWESLTRNHETGLWTDDLLTVEAVKNYTDRLIRKYEKMRRS